MPKYSIPLSTPKISGNEWQYVKECLDTEWVSSSGKYVDLFEKKIADRDIPDEIRQNWIYGNSTHTIDLLRFFGGEITAINAHSKSLKEKNGDQFVATMKFESGALGTYTSHWFSPGGWSVTLYGEGVTVKFKPLEKGLWYDTDFNENEISPDEMDVKYKSGFYRQIEAFVNMVKTGLLKWPGKDLEDAYKTMLLAERFVNA
jgi:predicted dehydrogenase